MSQKEIIQRYLEAQGGWVKAGLVRSIRTQWGNIGFRGDRDLRQMYETPVARGKWGLEIEMDGKFRIVRYNPLARVKKLPTEFPITYSKQTIVDKINSIPAFPPKKEKEVGLF